MNMLSQEQIIDAAGIFTDTAQTTVGLETAGFDLSKVPSPAYSEIAATYHVDTQQTTLEVPFAPEARTNLANYPGLRVTVSKKVPTRDGSSRLVYFPGIILETKPGQYPQIGILAAGPDAIFDDASLAEHQDKPLSDFQQNMLSRLYGLQTPNAGQHGATGQANVGETAHGALIVVTAPEQITGLHGRVHQYIPEGLAKSISQAPRGQSGAVDLQTKKGIRPVRDDVVSALEAPNIAVSEKHQLPPKQALDLSLGQLVVGTTLAAVRSKAAIGFPQPDLQAGMLAVVGG